MGIANNVNVLQWTDIEIDDSRMDSKWTTSQPQHFGIFVTKAKNATLCCTARFGTVVVSTDFRHGCARDELEHYQPRKRHVEQGLADCHGSAVP